MHLRPSLTLAVLALFVGAGIAAAQQTIEPMPPSSGADEAPVSNGNHTNETNQTLPPPQVSPSFQRVHAAYPGGASFSVAVRNGASQTQSVTVTAWGPSSWRTVLAPYDHELSPGESTVVSGSVQALTPLPATGNVTLEVRGRDGASYATVQACFSSSFYTCPVTNGTGGGNGTKPPSNETKPPSNETKPPSNDTKPPSNETKPPSNETKPPSNETKPPSNDTKPPSNETKPPSNETKPPANDTAPAPDSPEGAASSDPSPAARVEVGLRGWRVRTAWTGEGSVPLV